MAKLYGKISLFIMQYSDTFFEGSEKKVEVVIDAGSGNLRDFGPDYWSNVVERCGATVLSKISNDHCDAYLLSESSLFVWNDMFLMITCGQTTLVESVVHFLNSFPKENILSIIFQRKNEYDSSLQKSDFLADVSKIEAHIKGTKLRFGYLDEHHTYMFHINRKFEFLSSDTTTELLLYHIQDGASSAFRDPKISKKEIREYLNIDTILDDHFIVDDHLFRPFGYSLNAIRDNNYLTIHISPQEDSSYVSFETNLNLNDSYPKFATSFIHALSPFAYDVVDFNTKTMLSTPSYTRINRFEDRLACGYDVNFSHYIRPREQAQKPIKIEGSI